jgi:hypothetical protein
MDTANSEADLGKVGETYSRANARLSIDGLDVHAGKL